MTERQTAIAAIEDELATLKTEIDGLTEEPLNPEKVKGLIERRRRLNAMHGEATTLRSTKSLRDDIHAQRERVRKALGLDT